MRAGGEILTTALRETVQAVRPGISTQALDVMAEASIRQSGGVPAFLGYNGFTSTLCTSVNTAVVHGIPGEYVLQDGDIISLDGGVKYDGWYTDCAVTVSVGTISDEAANLLAGTLESLEIAIRQARPGHFTGDLGAAVQEYAEGLGYGVVRDCVGHGIGRKLHEAPSVPNYGRAGEGTMFETGMALAIEPMIVTGSPEITIADDRWTVTTRDGSLAAHFEETVIVTEDLPLRLTPLTEVLSGVSMPGNIYKVR